MSITVGELIATLSLDPTDFNSQLLQTSRRLNEISRGFAEAGLVLSTAISAPIIGAVRESLTAFGEFDAAMARVKALGSVADRELFGQMTEAAKEFGRQGVFSAKNVADAMAELSAAGFSAESVLQTIPATMRLAQIESISLEKASIALSNVMKGFHISAEGASDVVDILAKTSAISAVTLTNLTNSLKYAAPAAQIAGWSLKEVAAGLAVLGDSGIRATSAGTAVRLLESALESLSPKKAAMLKELGINVFDATGHMKSFSDVVNALQPLVENASVGWKIFGRQFSSVDIIISNSMGLKQKIEELDAFKGSAKEMADIMMNNVVNSWKKFTATINVAFIEFGTALAPIAQSLLDIGIKVANFAVDAARWFGSLSLETRTFATVIGGLAAVVGPAFLAVAGLVRSMSAFNSMRAGLEALFMAARGFQAMQTTATTSAVAIGAATQSVNAMTVATQRLAAAEAEEAVAARAALTVKQQGQLANLTGPGAKVAEQLSFFTKPSVTSPVQQGLFTEAELLAVNAAKLQTIQTTTQLERAAAAEAAALRAATIETNAQAAAQAALQTQQGRTAAGLSQVVLGFEMTTAAMVSMGIAAGTLGVVAYTIISDWENVKVMFGDLKEDFHILGSEISKLIPVIAGYFDTLFPQFIGLRQVLQANIGEFMSWGDAVRRTVYSVASAILEVNPFKGLVPKLRADLQNSGFGGLVSEVFNSVVDPSTRAKAGLQDAFVGLRPNDFNAKFKSGAPDIETGALTGWNAKISAIRAQYAAINNEIAIGTKTQAGAAAFLPGANAASRELGKLALDLKALQKAGKVTPVEFEAFKQKISETAAVVTDFSQRYIGFGETLNRTTGGVTRGAKAAENAFAAAHKQLEIMISTVPTDAEDFANKFMNPKSVQTALESLEKFRVGVLNNKDLTAKAKDSLTSAVKAQEDALMEMADNAGLTVEGSFSSATEKINASVAAWKHLAQAGLDPIKDFFKKDITGSVSDLQVVADEAKKAADILRGLKFSGGREMTPGGKDKLDEKVREAQIAAAAGMSFKEVEARFSTLGVKAKELGSAIKQGGEAGFTGLRKTAETNLKMVEDLMRAGLLTIPEALVNAKNQLANAKLDEATGKSFKDLQAQARELGTEIKDVWKNASMTPAQANDLEAAKTLYADIEKRVKLTGLGFAELQKQAENVRLREWATNAGVHLEEFHTKMTALGISTKEFFDQVAAGPDRFQQTYEAATEMYNKASKTAGISAAYLRKLYNDMQDAGFSAKFKASLAEVDAELKTIGLSMESVWSELRFQKISDGIQEATANLVKYGQAGMLSNEQIMASVAMIEQQKLAAVDTYFDHLRIGTSTAADMYKGLWDKTIQTGVAGFTKAFSDTSAMFVKTMGSLFNIDIFKFDGKGAIDSIGKMGTKMWHALKKSFSDPVNDMFNNLLNGITGLVGKFVSDVVLGTLYKGMQQIVGHIPSLSGALASAFGGAKDIVGAANAATSAAVQTAKAAAMTAQGTEAIGAAANKMWDSVSSVGQAGTALTTASAKVAEGTAAATNATISATKSVSSIMSSVMSIAGMISQIGTFVTGILSYTVQRRMEKDIARIEESTRWTKGLLQDLIALTKKAMGQGMLEDNLAQINETINGRIFELQLNMVEGFNAMVNHIEAMSSILNGDLVRIYEAILAGGVGGGGGGESARPDTETGTPNTPVPPAGTFSPSVTNPYVEEAAKLAAQYTASLGASMTDTEDNLRQLDTALQTSAYANQAGAVSATAVSAAADMTSTALAGTAASAVSASEAIASYGLSATTVKYTEKLGDFVDKSSKELHSYVTQFGSNLRTSNQLYDNGMHAIIEDTTTHVRFLVNAYDNQIVRVLRSDEYLTAATNAVAAEFVKAGDTAAGATQATSNLAYAAQNAGDSLDAVGQAANSLAGAVGAVAAKVDKQTAYTAPVEFYAPGAAGKVESGQGGTGTAMEPMGSSQAGSSGPSGLPPYPGPSTNQVSQPNRPWYGPGEGPVGFQSANSLTPPGPVIDTRNARTIMPTLEDLLQQTRREEERSRVGQPEPDPSQWIANYTGWNGPGMSQSNLPVLPPVIPWNASNPLPVYTPISYETGALTRPNYAEGSVRAGLIASQPSVGSTPQTFNITVHVPPGVTNPADIATQIMQVVRSAGVPV
jgi:TP901 family phage tail tape measure protein